MAPDKRPITAEDLYQLVYVEDPRISPNGRWVAYVQTTVDKFENGYKRNIWLAPTAGGQPIQLTRSGKDTQPRWSPDGRTLAFTSGRFEKPQIYLLPVSEPGGEPRQLTKLTNGASGPAWSPDGQHIAFLSEVNAAERAKEDENESAPQLANKLESHQRQERKNRDEAKRFDPRIVQTIPYRTGTSYLDDRFCQVYVISTTDDEAQPRRLTNLDADHAEPRWSPDGTFIYTARIDDPERGEPWYWSSLYRLRVSDAALEELTDSSYSSQNPLPSPDGQWVAYVRYPREHLSERITRLALLPANGGQSRDLNHTFDRSVSDYKWLPDSSGLIFTALNNGNIEIHRLTLADGNIKKLVSGLLQVENIDLHPDGGIAFTASAPQNPSELYWLPAGTTTYQPLTTANQKFLEQVIVQETHELRWQSPSGVEIQGWYLLPIGYEAGQTYPLAFNIHGGPHVMWGPGTKSMWHEWQFQAARGYAVFYANPHGAEGYGETFQMGLHGAWGDVATADLMAGIDTLLAKGFVDSERLAVTGGSYGGYMTAWLVGHTDRFKAAVSHRGVYNLLSFTGTTDIFSFIFAEYGVQVWDDPLRLWQESPLAYAHKIKTPLLIMHSENDFRVPIAEAEQLFAYVYRSGGTVQLVRYPRDGHEMTRSGEPEHRVSSLTHTIEWFDKYCQKKGVSPK
ncbi:MAG TPA: S9 family peptidase [Phototrophicaceae bacterium]|nr:S9 family peptidase [Phototrophicaceae bacterium]